jgi:hypothetical protein
VHLLTDANHNEPSLRDSQQNANEEEKELEWARLSIKVLGISVGTTCVNQTFVLEVTSFKSRFWLHLFKPSASLSSFKVKGVL